MKTSSPTDEAVPALHPYKDEVLGVLTVGLKAPDTAHAALNGVTGMVKTIGLLSDEELGFIVHNVNEILQLDEFEDAQ